jgi:YD repeat-containing protein
MSLKKFASATAMGLVLAGSAFAQSADVTIEGLPSVQITQGPLISPSDAVAYYNSLAGALTSPATSTDPRDPRIQLLADNLDNDAWRIYEYVKNFIEITPQFGLQKGAFGAILDGYGNPFDQANLMVELLREAGHTASYQFGEIEFSGASAQSGIAQFTSWMGTDSARGACELLAGGGIPAIINGSSSTDCSTHSNISGSLNSVRMSHVWVIADLGNGTRAYDPSFKRHIQTSPSSILDYPILPNPDEYRNATGGEIGTYNGIASINGMNAASVSSLNTLLTEASTTLLNSLQLPENMNQSLAEIAGGTRIAEEHLFDLSHDTATGVLPYEVAATSQWAGDIPTGLRATVDIDITLYISGSSDSVTFDVAEIAGRRLTVVPFSMIGPSSSNSIASLYLDEEMVAQATFDGGCAGCTVDGYGLFLTLDVDHPFAASTGSFMDNVTSQPTSDLVPSVIMHSWGDRGTGAESRNSSAYGAEGTIIRKRPLHSNINVQGSECSQYVYDGQNYYLETVINHNFNIWIPLPENTVGTAPSVWVGGDGPVDGTTYLVHEFSYPTSVEWEPVYSDATIALVDNCTVQFEDVALQPFHSAQMRTKMQIAESYLARAESQLRLTDALTGGRHITHNMVGISTSRADYGSDGSLREDQAIMSITSRLAYGSGSDSSPSRNSYSNTVASGLSALESAIVMEATGAVEANSTASMFSWFLTSTNVPSGGVGAGGTRPFLLVDSDNQASALSELFEYGGPVSRWSGVFTANDFELIMPLSGRLGPNLDSIRFNDEDTPLDPNHWRIMGSAYLAFRPSSSDLDEISHMVAPPCDTERSFQRHSVSCIRLPMKGAGGASFASEINSPAAEQDYLAEQYDVWASSFSVDVGTGSMTFSPPADIETGAGGFPYSLSFQRTYNSQSHRRSALGDGWSHNLEAQIQVGSDVRSSLSGGAQSAVATLVAADAVLSLFETGGDQVDMVRAMLIQNWWANSLVNNRVSVSRGSGSAQFHRMPDGQFISGPGSRTTLVQTGSIVVDEEWGEYSERTPEPWLDVARNYRRAFDYSALGFTLTTETGLVETFTYGADPTHGSALLYSADGSAGKIIGSHNSFLLTQTSFPTGVNVNYTYGANGLSQVSNNLGRSLNFTYIATPPPDPNEPAENSVAGSTPHGPASILSSVTDENGRQVTFNVDQSFIGQNSRRLNSVTDPSNNVFSYDYTIQNEWRAGMSTMATLPAQRVLLTEVRLPHAPTVAQLAFGYDEIGRLITATDADGDTTKYGVGEGARGFTEDPLGNQVWSYFYQGGRGRASMSPRGILSISYSDGIGRPIENRVSEADWVAPRYAARSTQTYDEYNNVISQSAHPRTDEDGDPLPNAPAPITLTTAYTHPGIATLPTRSTDAEGNVSVVCYSINTPEAACTERPAEDLDEFDRGGLPRISVGPSGEEILVSYDSLGRITRHRIKVGE